MIALNLRLFLFPRTAVALLASAAFLFTAMAVGQNTVPEPAKTNFSGRWRMLKDKSDFASFKMPDVVVRVVEQRGTTMNVHTVQTTGTKTSSADVSYFTDGAEAKNVISGRDAVSKAFWDGPALMVRTNTTDSKGEDELIEDRWELSADGQTLTMTSHVTTPNGEVEMKLVCAKEKT